MMRFFDPPNGLWRIRVYGVGDIDKSFHAWLPITRFLSENTRFVSPSPETTLTNPATAVIPMCVCAYDHYSNSLYLNGSRDIRQQMISSLILSHREWMSMDREKHAHLYEDPGLRLQQPIVLVVQH